MSSASGRLYLSGKLLSFFGGAGANGWLCSCISGLLPARGLPLFLGVCALKTSPSDGLGSSTCGRGPGSSRAGLSSAKPKIYRLNHYVSSGRLAISPSNSLNLKALNKQSRKARGAFELDGEIANRPLPVEA